MLVNVRRTWNIVSREVKGTVLGLAAAASALSVTFTVAAVLRDFGDSSRPRVQALAAQVTARLPTTDLVSAAENSSVSAQLVRGQALFSQECASCHGDHAQGGFGPDLRQMELPEAQVTAAIQNGIKPGMPSFGKKYGPADVQAMTAYVTSLHK